jgi:hypothetical protein
MLIYEPKLYSELCVNVGDHIYDNHTGKYVGEVIDLESDAISVSTMMMSFWRCGFFRKHTSLIEHGIFDVANVISSIHSILWYYSLKNNKRIKC